jgi:transposase
MRNSKEIILKALELRKLGYSYGEISKCLNNIVSRQTIYKWIDKYSNE